MEYLGKNIRKIRTARNLSMRDLAERVGVSASFISQVEQGKTSPSIATLKKIAVELGTTIGYLIDELPPVEGPVTKGKNRKKIENAVPGVTIELLTTPDIHKTMEPFYFTLSPGMTSTNRNSVHHGQEFVFVIEGQIEILLSGDKYLLEENDSIYFNSSIPHSFHNPGDKPARAVWVVMSYTH
jgi:transcriptional regulator with XRE-family HTH domain